MYTAGGGQLDWRSVEGSQLPAARTGLRAAMVNSVLYVTGGLEDDYVPLTSILSWDNDSETWNPAGDLKVARYSHAAVAIPSSYGGCGIESKCPPKP